ncbi:tRNA (adenine-N1)-methyltransferase [Aminithiophilus ramosus]|uniref:tRNA (adenine(58)-N(1))-methyltransferase TrmI n=2 Tax=Synergistales TaxID=649776 RepID=A0A9Q7A9P7_9BACT|nr:tRNA (adenine-N1)-methyltransferase [Aminithiophilus ramosus]QTX33090.1 tRNA (adenine-N1)-methyltransferase [Aminithiophilus ramosus]QVL37148.1 tRNA (adenine-N1)-methyltransferase [Synergistota bacterium]
MLNEGDLVLLWSPHKGDSYLLSLKSGAFQGTRTGTIPHDSVAEASYGGVVTTGKGQLFYVLRPTSGEFMRRIRRQTQIIYPKDAGLLLLYLDIFPGARVLECGTGSGSLTSLLGHFVGESGRVYSYDRREEFSLIARDNCRRWGVEERVTFRIGEAVDGFEERDVDALVLDLPSPWEALDAAHAALAPGRRLAALVPTTNQLERLIDGLNEGAFVDIQVLETFLRTYRTNARRIRPDDTMIGHTGYLVIATAVLARGGSGEGEGADEGDGA